MTTPEHPAPDPRQAAVHRQAAPPSDPCAPRCEPGGVCRTPECGRLRSSELMRLYGSSEAAPAPVVPAERARLLQWFGAVQDLNPAYLEPEDHQLAERLRGTVSEGPPAQDPEFVALMAMSEAEIDAELRALGIDPETAARKAAGAIAEGVARARCRGYICRLCGKDTPHHHTAEEVVIFRNGVKFARLAAPSADRAAAPVGQPAAQAVEVRKEADHG